MAGKRKLIILCIAAALLITLGGVGFYYWYSNEHFVSTDDARVAGDFVQITPKVSGELLEFDIKEGDSVTKGQIIGRIGAAGLDDANLDMSFLRAPISGLIIKKQAAAGEFVSSGTALAVLVDPNQLYISANIQETKLQKIKLGQTVDVTIDQYDSKAFTGKVESIGEATNSAFSLLPSSQSGTFTKVVQNIPVKISLENAKVKLLPDTSALVKIHLK